MNRTSKSSLSVFDKSDDSDIWHTMLSAHTKYNWIYKLQKDTPILGNFISLV